ncbi:MAG: glycoside hydrolase family 108 protein [Burkholderiales bacterium]
MSASFDVAFGRLMDHEGGYVNDKADPGGETKFGISKRSYPDEDIPNMTRDRAMEIFRRDFWDRVNADRLPDGVAFQLADFAYHSGADTAVRYLQRALGVADDGHWGKVSQAAADAASESDMILRLNGERLDFMTRRKNWPEHGRGWARRIAANLRFGAEDS